MRSFATHLAHAAAQPRSSLRKGSATHRFRCSRRAMHLRCIDSCVAPLGRSAPTRAAALLPSLPKRGGSACSRHSLPPPSSHRGCSTRYALRRLQLCGGCRFVCDGCVAEACSFCSQRSPLPPSLRRLPRGGSLALLALRTRVPCLRRLPRRIASLRFALCMLRMQRTFASLSGRRPLRYRSRCIALHAQPLEDAPSAMLAVGRKLLRGASSSSIASFASSASTLLAALVVDCALGCCASSLASAMRGIALRSSLQR